MVLLSNRNKIFSLRIKKIIFFLNLILNRSFVSFGTPSKLSSLPKLSSPSIINNKTLNALKSFQYPHVHRDDTIVEDFFGTKIADPFRWLENTESNETLNFIRNQNAITVPYLRSCSERKKIRERLRKLYRYERFSCPFKYGGDYYIYINSGLQNHHVLHRLRNGIDDLSQLDVFFDPNILSRNGSISLSMQSFSEDGKWWAYGLRKSGSDWNTLRIRSVENRTDLDEKLINIKFSAISWTIDNRGFFYSRYPESSKQYDGTETTVNQFNKLFYHRIGTSQKDDILITHSPKEPSNRFYGIVSDCGQYLHVLIKRSSENEEWYYHRFKDGKQPKITPNMTLKPVATGFDASYDILTNDGPIHYVLTNRNAPNNKIVRINLTDNDSLQESKWTDLVLEHPNDVLRSASVAHNDIIVCHYVRDAISRLELRNLTNGELIKEIDIPIGMINQISCDRRNNTDLFYSITSFLMPISAFRLRLNQNLTTAKPELFKKSEPEGFDPEKFITKQLFLSSKDGTKVPLFVVHRRNLTMDSNRPTVLYGYGGFNTVMHPHYVSTRMILLDNLDGVYAMAAIRGGGEYGEKWHKDGKLLKKQNCFDDFISAAEYLVRENYTKPERLIIEGGSNGGLLVMAVSNQKPKLFGCTICRVGLLDMLRYHKFTIGHTWISEYGDPDNSEEFFHYIHRYSPLHNVPKNITKYPATLLLTADHDDRVVPLHSYKMIAQLQQTLGEQLPQTPLMIRIDTDSGHGGGKPTEKIIEENVDVYSFIINSLNLVYDEKISA
ncbi:Prolyl endopeptidase [Sarcoptes scabiei]|uniref:Prolyl endopeptidase n=1 Tax=Sarcoptes scabiei TaxID=52283 RepID=A0A834R3N6_SARSC|nr:Prolyl endopeptidase [Sarcoptes scabiei]